jgi:hypothetical protein
MTQYITNIIPLKHENNVSVEKNQEQTNINNSSYKVHTIEYSDSMKSEACERNKIV